MASVGRVQDLTLIIWSLVKGMRTFSSAAESLVSDELPVNLIMLMVSGTNYVAGTQNRTWKGFRSG